MPYITFLPQEITILAHSGDTVLDAALDNGIKIQHECGGNCACTTCHIYVLGEPELLSAPEEVELDRLSTADNAKQSSRLACQALLTTGNVIVQIVEI